MLDPTILASLYGSVFDAMKATGPNRLVKRAVSEAAIAYDDAHLADEDILVSALSQGDVSSDLIKRFRTELALWDSASSPLWGAGSEPKSDDRRRRVYALLEASVTLTQCLDSRFPVAKFAGGVVISQQFEPWYAESQGRRSSFYWDHYRSVLLGKGWDPGTVANLDLASSQVVERLADPQRETAYQAKGLVVGYVQSGKTANFTGVIAKAVDAGYRLIIVLTGSTDLLRSQTQRRLDKELVGKENLLRGIDLADVDSTMGVDYFGDPDWDTFVEHGVLPSTIGEPDAYRLTTQSGDYKALQQGIEALDFAKFDTSKPLNAPENLERVPFRIAVVKKHSTVLGKLVKDLKKITAKLGDIPALIIDDESDQASVNTANPAKWKQGKKERTAINGHISDLLRLLPRGQYIGYTATPFANVFVDPTDVTDIFPRDFLISLDRPPTYMGARDFHDLAPLGDDAGDLAVSNEAAFVRSIPEDGEDERLRDALDSFVLTGAIKLHREAHGVDGDFQHHTMLVHESVKQSDHSATAEKVAEMWRSGGWFEAGAAQRLRVLYETDFQPVTLARSGTHDVPFTSISPLIGKAVARIEGPDRQPAWVINGDKEMAQHDLDFDARSVWKVMVGGAKLSRGFTVEGLTISYYRRSTSQADSLMQMGRWFGFRRGYQDLVRLYIGRAAPGRPLRLDLYAAFEAACRSEELFREEIAHYGELVDGRPQLTPADIPPLVAQYVPWLKPAAANKMYNAQLVERRSPGRLLEKTGYPGDPKVVRQNAAAMAPLMIAANRASTLPMRSNRHFKAYVGGVTHTELLAALRALRWDPEDHFKADLNWLEDLAAGQVNTWKVILPQLEDATSRRGLFGKDRSVHVRQRREDRTLFGGISDPKHRDVGFHIAGAQPPDVVNLTGALREERTGVVLIYPVFEQTLKGALIPPGLTENETIFAFALIAPPSPDGPRGPLVRFQAIRPNETAPIVDVIS